MRGNEIEEENRMAMMRHFLTEFVFRSFLSVLLFSNHLITFLFLHLNLIRRQIFSPHWIKSFTIKFSFPVHSFLKILHQIVLWML